MTNPDTDLPSQPADDRGCPIERLLFVADAAVAEVGDLPPAVRVLIDAAAQIFVLTPAVCGPDHANWQERGLIDHVEARIGLPVTIYAVDSRGHAARR